MIGKISGTGSYVPSRYLDNHNLSQIVDTSDEWIQERTGIIRRHIVEADTTVSMAAQAAEKVLESAKMLPEEIDLLIVSTISSNVILPCTACEVQKQIHAVHATCFDLNAACTGFLFAYNTAQAYIASGMYKNVLVIGAESLSSLVDWKDRSTCILFGDGAGAVVLRAEEGESYHMVTHSDGSKGEALTCDTGSFMKMDGQEVFKFAVRQVPACIAEVMEHNHLMAEDIDYFILHQANRRIVEAVAKRMKVELTKFPMNLQEYGNTSSASIPLLLDEMNREGRLKKACPGRIWSRTLVGSKLVRVVISLWDYIKTESKISEIKGEKKMLEKVKEIVADSLGADVETLTEATSFKEDLGADSLDLFEMVMAFEEEFEKEIPSEDLEQLTTIGAVVAYLEK